MKINISDIKVNHRKRDTYPHKVNQLADSIEKLGLLQPIIVSKDNELISGLHRIEACKSLGHEKIAAEIKDFDEMKKELAQIDENLIRAELSILEQGEQLLQRDELLSHLGERAKRGDNRWTNNRRAKSAHLVSNNDIATEVGISKRTLQERKQIARNLHPTVKQMMLGTHLADKMTELMHISRLSHDKQKKVTRILLKSKNMPLRNAMKKVLIAERKNKDNFEDLLKKNRKYSILMADPPWEYDGGFGLQAYPSMKLEEIMNLPVRDITADNCALFLWTTFPKLREGLRVIEAWGFDYKTVGFVWVKTNKGNGKLFLGIGNYTRSNAEICLLGLKGRMVSISDNISSVIISPMKRYSEKPDEVRTKIVELFGNLPRVELFATKKVKGWTTWGKGFETIMALPRSKS